MNKEEIPSQIFALPQNANSNQKLRPSQEQPFSSINLVDLGQYRVKNHCHYDPQTVGTTDYSIFQIELLDEALRQSYQGRFLLEIWSKQGERIYQKILKEECTQWKLYRDVFVFKSSIESPLIHIIWLKEKKMIAVKHPYDDHREVDLIYYDGYLIVAQPFNFRFTQINPTDVNTTVNHFLNPDESQSNVHDTQFVGIIQNDRIVQLLPHPMRSDLLFICCSESSQLLYYRLVAAKASERRQISLQKLEVDPAQLKKKSKLEKKMQKLLDVSSEIVQIQCIVKNMIPYLVILRRNQTVEVVENFLHSVYAEQIVKLVALLPSFGDKIAFQFNDGSIAQANSMDKINERSFMTDVDYYRQQILPPKYSPLSDIHRNIHFFTDSVIVNQSLFLLRDNIVFIVDTFTKQVVAKYTQKQKIMSLHKLKLQSEDENGYKQTVYKVVAANKNGTLQVFTPSDNILMKEWNRQELADTPMVRSKDPISSVFQNQSVAGCIYFVTQGQDAQKVYQMLFNTQIIEMNLKLVKGDFIFSVNSFSRMREIIGTVDSRYLTFYRNDKGNLVKMYQYNHSRTDLKDNITSHSIFYFQKDSVFIVTKQIIIKINIATSAQEQVKLQDLVKKTGNCFIDGSCFYFITESGQEGQSKLAVADISMIESSFQESQDKIKNAIADKEFESSNKRLTYPSWHFANSAKRLDFDEYNSTVNVLLSSLEIVQMPLLHRNTMQFNGMAERPFYLAFKKHGDKMYALDKENYMNCWSMVNGQMLWRSLVTSGDYKMYEVDRDVYDKNWFNFTVISKPIVQTPAANESVQLMNQESPSQNQNMRMFKIVKIDEQGKLLEFLTFQHASPQETYQHLYFSDDFQMMIELLIQKSVSNSKPIYKSYTLNEFQPFAVDKLRSYRFNNVLNSSVDDQGQFIEWHQKTFYPYSLDVHNFALINQDFVKGYEVYKHSVIGGKPQLKVLNVQDGIEMLLNADNGKLEGYMALQYSFPNTKDSFYDKVCGHFYIQEVTSRLQNYFEEARRRLYLENKAQPHPTQLDVSARDYKYKYVIEHSFTHLDFKYYTQFMQNQEKELTKLLKAMSKDHLQRFVHNIFPDGNNTLLHFIAQNNAGFESIDYLGNLAKKEGFIVPFLINQDQMTPLDLTVLNKDFKQTNSIVKMLSKSPLDHHSRLISHLTPTLIEMNLPALEKYFDRRRFQIGVCKSLTLGRLKITQDEDFTSVTTTLINDNKEQVQASLMTAIAKEQSLTLEVLDLPLQQFKNDEVKIGADLINDYEIKLIKSLANTENQDIFSQKTIRAFIEFLWPQAKSQIINNVFMPYLAFVLYYMMYLVVLRKIGSVQETDPTFIKFASGMFDLSNLLFKIVLFLGCSYFFYQDFLQIKTFPNHSIALWTYANVIPLILMIFIMVWELFLDEDGTSSDAEKTFYSASSFFVWIRVVHLLKLFSQPAYLLRMGGEIMRRMKFLFFFIFISLIAFGFTFFFVAEFGAQVETPFQGFSYMFEVLLGKYSSDDFNNIYLNILLVIVNFFNFFFLFTLIIAISVVSFTKESGVWSNEAYQEKASMMALYSYLLQEKAVREPIKKYLLIASLSEGGKKHHETSVISSGSNTNEDAKQLHSKMIKNLDRRLNNLTSKVEKTLKEIQEKLENQQKD